jgi:hypothetical protein
VDLIRLTISSSSISLTAATFSVCRKVPIHQHYSPFRDLLVHQVFAITFVLTALALSTALQSMQTAFATTPFQTSIAFTIYAAADSITLLVCEIEFYYFLLLHKIS